MLIQVPCVGSVSDAELLRRFKVLYPKPTKYQVASFAEIERLLLAGGDGASQGNFIWLVAWRLLETRCLDLFGSAPVMRAMTHPGKVWI